MSVKKGIILAGGAGNRVYPMSRVVCKQLLPLYDKPMIYYPLATLMQARIRNILIISTPEDLPRFLALLGDGTQLGIHISYQEQPKPEGIAQAFLLAERWIDGQSVCLILGDNLFFDEQPVFTMWLRDEADTSTIFTYRVRDPERYGVVKYGTNSLVVDIVEKASPAPSHDAVVGLYIYDGEVAQKARTLKPSARGELEITDLNRLYLNEGRLNVVQLSRGVAWLDTGTPEAMQDAASFVAVIEARQGRKVGCIEEAAYRMGMISPDGLRALADAMPPSPYREYVVGLLPEEGRKCSFRLKAWLESQ